MRHSFKSWLYCGEKERQHALVFMALALYMIVGGMFPWYFRALLIQRGKLAAAALSSGNLEEMETLRSQTTLTELVSVKVT